MLVRRRVGPEKMVRPISIARSRMVVSAASVTQAITCISSL
jgi:hypothetical protein